MHFIKITIEKKLKRIYNDQVKAEIKTDNDFELRYSMNRKIQVTSNTNDKKMKKKIKFRYSILITFIIAVLIISFIIYMLQTSVNDII